MNEKHERKENKKRRKGLLLLLLALLLVGGVGTWLLFGEALTGGRTPHEPARPAAPVTQLAEPGETTEPADPTSPEDPTEPGTDEPTAPTEPTNPEPADPNDPVTTEPTTPDEPTEPTNPAPEPVHTHSYTDTRTEPTCTAEGKIVKKCNRCGDTKTETIPKLTPSEPINPEPVHTHSYTDTRTEPTCTQDGKIVSKCGCGDAKTETIPKLGHDHSEPVYETRTVEKVVGYETHAFCGACGMDFNEAGFSQEQLTEHMKAHALVGESSRYYTDIVEITETVTEQILVGHKCSRCGDMKRS